MAPTVWPSSVTSLEHLGEERKDVVMCGCVPGRYAFALLGFLGMLPVFALRASIGIAMVDMVTSPTVVVTSEECGAGTGNGTTTEAGQSGEFDWDERTQGIIFGSFFWGYMLLQFPSGRLAERFGGKWLFGGAVLCTCVCAILTPVAARSGYPFFITVRFLSGLAEGALYPSMQNMLSKLALVHEKEKMGTFIYAGAQVGVLLGMPIAGLLCDCDFDGGWPLVFYVFGTMGILWFGPWAFFVYGHSPCPKLSRHSHTDKALTFPWKEVMTSTAMWGIIVSHFINEWGFYTLITQVPTYMKNILKFDIKQNSVYTALPYLGRWILAVSSSCLADHIRATGKASRTTVVKVANFIGMACPGTALVAITFVGCGQLWNVIILTLAVSTGGVMYAGFFSNHMDIAPRFAGTLISITNTIASVPGIVSPYVTGVLMGNQQTLPQWHIIFYIAAAFYFFAAIFYSIFASGVEQPWNRFTSGADDEKRKLNETPYYSSDSLTMDRATSKVVLLSVNTKNDVKKTLPD